MRMGLKGNIIDVPRERLIPDPWNRPCCRCAHFKTSVDGFGVCHEACPRRVGPRDSCSRWLMLSREAKA